MQQGHRPQLVTPCSKLDSNFTVWLPRCCPHTFSLTCAAIPGEPSQHLSCLSARCKSKNPNSKTLQKLALSQFSMLMSRKFHNPGHFGFQIIRLGMLRTKSKLGSPPGLRHAGSRISACIPKASCQPYSLGGEGHGSQAGLRNLLS